ncbi:hypothetical protein ALC60_12371 [Trachymyrmex zeteki]|uniref:Uncharacterized protein n=1 Tax=Mycetomoellerius zeteki TaxID=64791 RepID=A0A151WL37_9HYME|nr:hypothetical protein ALC60_12371 [Trachymyrmex zeteki]
MQLERLVNKNLRLALGYRLSTPINVIMAEAKETPLQLRFGYMTSKFIYRIFSKKNSPVLHSFEYLEQVTYSAPRRQQVLATVPALKYYVTQKHTLKIMQRSSVPYAYKYSYESSIYIQQFDSSLTSIPKKSNARIYIALSTRRAAHSFILMALNPKMKIG